MIKFISYASGAVDIVDDDLLKISLSKDKAHRLILTARMHGVDDFIKKLPQLINHENWTKLILKQFENKSKTQSWNLKEKFARLVTITKDYQAKNPDEILDEVFFND